MIPAEPNGSYGGGTSSSVDLAGFTLDATGSDFGGATLAQPFARRADNQYMAGNPFPQPIQLSGVTVQAAAGTIGTVFSVWDPSAVSGAGSFVNLGPTDYVATWQGFFANVTPTATTFTYTRTATPPTTPPPFYGRGASVANVGVKFHLEGTTADGPAGDLAAEVRFLSDALVGADCHDGGKFLPPGGTYALLAPMGEVDGVPTRLSMNSFPEALASGVTVPMAFTATSAGTFTVSWENTLPGGRSVTLHDVVTGTTVDLATAAEYTFASDATDWATRFELVLGRGAVAGEAAPAALRVGTFAPNPAVGTSRLTFSSDVAQTVRASVIDALGREVVVLFDAAVTAGTETSLSVEAGRLAPGTYAVRIAGETFSETRRLTVVR